MQTSKSVLVFATTTLGLSLVLLLTAAVPFVASVIRKDSSRNLRAEARVAERVITGTEVIAYFVGSSTCGASNHPDLPAALSQIRGNLSAQAKRQNKRFVFVGVALDNDPSRGLSFLEHFGPYDEIMAGGSWVGMGAVALRLRDLPGPLSLPQLVIVERDVKAEPSYVEVSADRIVARKLGFDEILRFRELSARSPNW